MPPNGSFNRKNCDKPVDLGNSVAWNHQVGFLMAMANSRGGQNLSHLGKSCCQDNVGLGFLYIGPMWVKQSYTNHVGLYHICMVIWGMVYYCFTPHSSAKPHGTVSEIGHTVLEDTTAKQRASFGSALKLWSALWVLHIMIHWVRWAPVIRSWTWSFLG